MLSISRSSARMSGYWRSDLPERRLEEAPGRLHDVRLVHRRHVVTFLPAGELEGESNDPVRSLSGDNRHRLGGGVLPVDPVLHPRVEPLGRLPDDDEVGLGEPRALPGDRSRRSDRREQVELLAKRDVHRTEPAPDRGRNRALEGDTVLADGLKHLVGKRRARRLNRLLAGLRDLPIEGDTGGLAHEPGRVGDLGSDPVPRYQCHAMTHLDPLGPRELRRDLRNETGTAPTRPVGRWKLCEGRTEALGRGSLARG